MHYAPVFWDSVLQCEPVCYFKKKQEYYIIKWLSFDRDAKCTEVSFMLVCL